MVEQLANYSAIIIALGMINVVYQLEKATRYIKELQRLIIGNFGSERE
jgi:hypothetical protein